MKHVPKYTGKLSDTTIAALEMGLTAANIKVEFLSDCLTLRSFARSCLPDNAPMWMCSFVEPFDGLLNALTLLKITDSCRIFHIESTKGNLGEFLEVIASWLHDGPVIVGPLDRSVIWSRIETRYYFGNAHFILIYCSDEDGWRIHDPEGCPNLRLITSQLQSAMQRSMWNCGAIQIRSGPTTVTASNILSHVLRSGLGVNQRASELNISGSMGLNFLASKLATRKLKSSEAGALYYAVPNVMLSVGNMFNLIDNQFWYQLVSLTDWNHLKSEWLELTVSYCKTCAYLLMHLHNREHHMLIQKIKDMANYEYQMSILLRESVDLLPAPGN